MEFLGILNFKINYFKHYSIPKSLFIILQDIYYYPVCNSIGSYKSEILKEKIKQRKST